MTELGSTAHGGAEAHDDFDLDRRWVAGGCTALCLLFFLFGLLSEGTVTDDDIGRYINTRAAFRNPIQFIGLWNRPAFVIAYALPAQLGYWAVELFTALVAALTCYLVYRTARARRQANAFVGIALIAFQPEFFMLSFSALVEPLAALFIAASLHALYSGRYKRSAILATLIPLARIELSVVLAIWAIKYLRDGRWRLIIILPLGLLAWSLAGALVTGDPLYLYNQIATGEERMYVPFPVWHYPWSFIFIVGPVAFALFLVGLFHAIRHRKLDLVHWSFLLMFLTYTWLSWRSVTGRVQAAGHLRHFVALAPFAALIALQGFNQWMRGIRSSVFTLGSLAVVVAVTGVFLSRTLEGELALPGPAEHLKLAIVAAIALIAVVRGTHYIAGLRQRWIKIAMIILTIGLSVGYLAARRSPIPVSHEREMIKSAATWYCGAGLQDRVTLCNHAWFRFFCDANHLLPEQCSSLTRASLAAAPAGAIAIWDGHYGHRLSGDVDLDYFRSDRNWRVHHRFHGPDVTQFFAVALEKIDGRGLRTTTPDRDRYENAGLGIQMDLAWALDWNIELREEGPVILTGAHRKIRLGVVLGFERYLGVFNDTRGYASTMNQEIAATRGVQLIETWMPETQPINALAAQGRQWARTRYLGGGYEHDVRVTVSARQGATLRVHFQYPPGHCEAVAKAVDDVVASLDLTGF